MANKSKRLKFNIQYYSSCFSFQHFVESGEQKWTYEKKLTKLQNQYDDLLEQNELERLDSKQSLNTLKEQYEFNIAPMYINLTE